MAPKTGKEKMQKFRDKLNQDQEKAEAFRAKDRERKKLQRQIKKQQQSRGEKAAEKRYERERKRQQRLQKKEARKSATATNDTCTPIGAPGVYTSSSSLGKAVKRIKNSLPSSPRHRSVAFGQTLQDELNKMRTTERNILLSRIRQESVRRKLVLGERKIRSDALSPATINAIKDFYELDDISRVSPSARDAKTIIENGEKIQAQKRTLMFNLSEVHQLFLEQNPSVSVGLSKFCELRPQNVLPLTDKDQEVCACRYHENVELIARSLSKIVTGIPQQGDHLVAKTVCSTDDEMCMSRDCENCGVEMLDAYFGCVDISKPVTYYQWSSVDNRVQKVPFTCSVLEIKEEFYQQLRNLSRHSYDAKQQHRELRHLKETLKPGSIVLHEDFAENFAIKQQNEIMSAHWVSVQVTVFTAIAYFRLTPDSELQHESFAIVSDSLNHDKFSVYAFNAQLLEHLQQKLPWDIKYVHYWSDGAASQFKNKFTFANLLFHQADNGSAADWSFFATSHGKGPIDGIGATVKRSVWRKILQGKTVINNAEEFFKEAEEINKTVTLMFISEPEIHKATSHLKPRWENCLTVKGTQSYHFVKPSGENLVYCANNSPFTDSSRVMCVHPVCKPIVEAVEPAQAICEQEINNDINLAVSDFVLVQFHGDKVSSVYVAQIVQVDEDDYELTVMRVQDARKTKFSLPAGREDTTWVNAAQIVKKLPVPQIDHRSRYIFEESQPVSA